MYYAMLPVYQDHTTIFTMKRNAGSLIYILTGLAGVAHPATTAVVPTSPPLYYQAQRCALLSASTDDSLQMSLLEQQQQ